MSNLSKYSGPNPLPFRENMVMGHSLPLGGRAGDGAVILNAKLFLFGEYGLMFDAMALSVPFPKFHGRLTFDKDGIHRESTDEIRKFLEHLQVVGSGQHLHFPFNLERLERDLEQGLYFDSNIPQQYGVGSSGALVAALFSSYADVPNSEDEQFPEILKADFAVLESFFHGRSSGLDPLISFVNKPLLIDSKKQICRVEFDLNKSGLAMALIDTQTIGATGPLVQYFIDRFNEPEFEKAFESQFIPANNGCINTLLNGNLSLFWGHLESLIHFQLQYFRRMIPGKFHTIISTALTEKVYIKLLGSGGGGFLLAMAGNHQKIEKFADKYNFEIVYV